MSVSSSTKLCPRCHTRLPAQMTFCHACGLQFSALDDDRAPFSRQGSETRWPSRSQPGYSSSSQSSPDSAPLAVAARPKKKGRAGKIIALVLVLLVLVGGGAAWFLYVSPSHVDSPLFDRHGLQSNVPLPDGISFAGLKQTYSAPDLQTHTTISTEVWGWTVSGSDMAALQTFYQDNLPKHGWTDVRLGSGFTPGARDVVACQGTQELLIIAGNRKLDAPDVNGRVTATITAPSGSSALLIEVSSNSPSAQFVCTAASIP